MMAPPIHHAPDGAAPWPSAPGWLPLDEPAIANILAIDDAAVRNVWITQSYADLGRRLLDVLDTDQTWCTFAIWASNTAGISIRGAELPHIFDALLHGADDHVDAAVERANDHPTLVEQLGLIGRFGRAHLDELVRTALGQVSEFIAHGNTLVYAELAPVFVRLVESLEQNAAADGTDHDTDHEEIDALLNSFGIASTTDHAYVRMAFANYLVAANADVPEVRAQSILAANVAAVLHEQQRLQDDIKGALDAGLIDARDELIELGHWLLPAPIRRWIADAAVARMAPHLERLWDHISTKLLLTLAVPGETLHLGVDVPALPDGTLFPTALLELRLAAAIDLMDIWDPTAGSGRGSAAADWEILHDRMGYIVNLFRSRQQTLDLTASPLTQADLDAMVEARLPPSLGHV